MAGAPLERSRCSWGGGQNRCAKVHVGSHGARHLRLEGVPITEADVEVGSSLPRGAVR